MPKYQKDSLSLPLTNVVCAGWWYKPDYMINELNINSAITAPAHEENQEYTEFTKVKGYAYAGQLAALLFFPHDII